MRLKIIDSPIPAVIANGVLAAGSACSFRVAVFHAFSPGERSLALDLTNVHYVDSDGLRAICGVHRLVRFRGGILGIALKHGALRDLVRTCGLGYQPEVEIFDSFDECAERLRSA
ncbi:MAG: STAS domain-containing protein [Actinobacteria bacterium]|nr:STAS domain-containing protein [Actinomycetota bacterium]